MVNEIAEHIISTAEEQDAVEVAEYGMGVGMGVAMWFMVWLVRQQGDEFDPRVLIDRAVEVFEINTEMAMKPYRKESEN